MDGGEEDGGEEDGGEVGSTQQVCLTRKNLHCAF